VAITVNHERHKQAIVSASKNKKIKKFPQRQACLPIAEPMPVDNPTAEQLPSQDKSHCREVTSHQGRRLHMSAAAPSL
jgi:hypothetical protein